MLSQNALRSMKARWLRDLARLEKACGDAGDLGDESNSETETVRNLATAIAHIGEMIIANVTNHGSKSDLDPEYVTPGGDA